MNKHLLISFILCLLAAAVLLGFGITGLVKPDALSANVTKISEWVMVSLGGILLIFAVISLSMGFSLINPSEWFGAKKIKTAEGEVSAVPPEGVKAAVEKFEDETGISVSSAKPSPLFSKGKKNSSSKSSKRRR